MSRRVMLPTTCICSAFRTLCCVFIESWKNSPRGCDDWDWTSYMFPRESVKVLCACAAEQYHNSASGQDEEEVFGYRP